MLTREEVLAAYKVENGCIVSPGKFEREPVYVPAYWYEALEGFFDDDDDGVFVFSLTESDRDMWPELGGAQKLYLEESDTGFVYSDLA